MKKAFAIYFTTSISKQNDLLCAVEIEIPGKHTQNIDYGIYTGELEPIINKELFDKFKEKGFLLSDLYPTIIPKGLYDFVNNLKGEMNIEVLESLFSIVYKEEESIIGNKKKITTDVVRQLYYELDGLQWGFFNVFNYVYRKIDVDTILDDGGCGDDLYWYYYKNFKK